jgi:hypothetical protein
MNCPFCGAHEDKTIFLCSFRLKSYIYTCGTEITHLDYKNSDRVFIHNSCRKDIKPKTIVRLSLLSININVLNVFDSSDISK